MGHKKVEAEYVQMRAAAEEQWVQNSTEGEFVGPPEGFGKVGLSVGSFYTLNDSLVGLYEELEQIASEDENLMLVPGQSLHFTFLALSNHIWESPECIDGDLPQLKSMYSTFVEGNEWSVQDLRIVPIGNCLLLAGIPNEESYNVRDNFAQALLNSDWKDHVLQRHQNSTFPPSIWHTTLCRYKYEYFPPRMREVYRKFRDELFGGFDLGAPELRAVSYDWSVSVLLE